MEDAFIWCGGGGGGYVWGKAGYKVYFSLMTQMSPISCRDVKLYMLQMSELRMSERKSLTADDDDDDDGSSISSDVSRCFQSNNFLFKKKKIL